MRYDNEHYYYVAQDGTHYSDVVDCFRAERNDHDSPLSKLIHCVDLDDNPLTDMDVSGDSGHSYIWFMCPNSECIDNVNNILGAEELTLSEYYNAFRNSPLDYTMIGEWICVCFDYSGSDEYNIFYTPLREMTDKIRGTYTALNNAIISHITSGRSVNNSSNTNQTTERPSANNPFDNILNGII